MLSLLVLISIIEVATDNTIRPEPEEKQKPFWSPLLSF